MKTSKRSSFPVDTEVKVDDDVLRYVIAVGATFTRREDNDGNFMVVPNTDMIGKTIQGRQPKGGPTPICCNWQETVACDSLGISVIHQWQKFF